MFPAPPKDDQKDLGFARKHPRLFHGGCSGAMAVPALALMSL